jgi:pilus assembly protein CpaE
MPSAAFVNEEASAAVVRRVQAARGWPAAAVEGGLATAAAALAQGPTPGILMLDLDGQADPMPSMEALADLCDPGTRVVAFGTANDVGLFRSLLALGIEDYLVKPLDERSLADALDRIADRIAERAARGEARSDPSSRGRLVAVLGARGGVGATSVAVNLAWTLSQACRRKAVLLDLDLRFGTTALALDCEPGRGLGEALADPDRVDELFLERAAVKVTDRLSLLCAEEGPDRRVEIREAGLAPVLSLLRDGFEEIVLDLPRGDVASLPAPAPGDRLVLVTDYSLAGLRDTVRLWRHLSAGGGSAGSDAARRILVVASHAGAPGRCEVGRADIEKAIGMPVAIEVPFEPKAFLASARAGMPVARSAPRCRAAAAFGRLADAVHPSRTAPPSLWKRIVKGGG